MRKFAPHRLLQKLPFGTHSTQWWCEERQVPVLQLSPALEKRTIIAWQPRLFRADPSQSTQKYAGRTGRLFVFRAVSAEEASCFLSISPYNEHFAASALLAGAGIES